METGPQKRAPNDRLSSRVFFGKNPPEYWGLRWGTLPAVQLALILLIVSIALDRSTVKSVLRIGGFMLFGIALLAVAIELGIRNRRRMRDGGGSPHR
jgi:hypothetical protein